MAMGVQVHPDKFKVDLFPPAAGRSHPFVTIDAMEDEAKVSVFLRTPARCDELIAAACEAKRLLTAAPDGEDEPGPYDAAIQQARAWAGHVTGGCTAVSDAGTGCTAPREDHKPPHRDINGYEWGGDGEDTAPHHATPLGELVCGAPDSRYVCTAQRGHGGPDHIAYGADGEVIHSWPVAVEDEAEVTGLCQFHGGSSDETGCARCQDEEDALDAQAAGAEASRL